MPKSINGLKVCSKKDCSYGNKPQSVANFYKRCASPDGLAGYCKDCSRIVEREWRKANPVRYQKVRKEWRIANPEIIRKRSLKRYNLTPEQYDLIIAQQGNKCGLCHEDFSYEGSYGLDYPCVHHNHETGLVVGIWHRGCNNGEGFIRTVKQAEALLNHIISKG
jgi:hypothetical protein